MALAVSDYLATALLNQVFRNTPFTPPTTVYLALYTSNPTAADTGTEVSGGGYQRMQIMFSAPVTENGKKTIKNSADIVFPMATANWGTISHVGIRDAATGGNLLYYGAVDNPRSIQTNDILKFPAGSLALNLS